MPLNNILHLSWHEKKLLNKTIDGRFELFNPLNLFPVGKEVKHNLQMQPDFVYRLSAPLCTQLALYFQFNCKVR